ncbi:MAG: beta-ketoacyl synthase N-terminal-like domain-containing protein, partial [Flammeovirgaceae bacterium]
MKRDIAIIGIAGRFAGASDIGKLRDNLLAGKNSIGAILPDRLKSVSLPA